MQERAWVNEKPVPLNPRNLFISAPTKMKESTKEVKLSMENYEKFRSLDNIEKYFKALTRLVEKYLAMLSFRLFCIVFIEDRIRI